LAALLGSVSTGCGGRAPAQTGETAPAGDSRFAERDRDSYTPPPGTLPHPPDAAALRAADPGSAARQVALRLVQALLDSDAATLQLLFAERVVFGMEGFGRPRGELVDRCIEETRPLSYEPDLRPADVVDVAAIEVRRAEHLQERAALPPGIRPGDLLVTLPPRNTGTRARARLACAGAVYVRLGARAQVVGVAR
jgi:hypothetical protein